MNYDVEHLCYVPPKPRLTTRIKRRIKRSIKRVLAFMGVRKYRVQFQNELRSNLRWERLKVFQDKHISRKIFMTHRQALSAPKSCWESYDYVLTGSDQVWHNWSRTPEELAYYYLEFVQREKRINYAPSLGWSKFPESDYELHRKGLQGFEKLSCREQEMQGLIREIVGRDAELVLDPTLLLRPEQWQSFESKPEYDLPERYLLCYVLEGMVDEYEQVVREAAQGLPIVNIYDAGNQLHKDSPYYLTHPGEFLYLFKHADFVCTDSFHGTAFSVNFGKNFLTFKRRKENMTDMFGRIESLLVNTGIKGHVYEPGVKIRPDEIDYGAVHSRLEAMRQSSMNYLRECLR